MDDWDLQAIVRGFNNNNNNIEGFPSYTIHSPQPNINCFDAFSFSLQENNYDPFHEDFSSSFFQSTTASTELEQLIYRPFCPTVHSLISSPTMLASCMSAPKQIQQQDDNQMNNAKASPPKSFKKRRNQQKREVKHVTEDGLSSDMWAWRKYGQKPIKGSPYPRSYYRCSSSKGCSARKQVERSPSNPEIFIVTYTAEHTHAHPTRRSSLAGSTRTKFPQPKTMSLDSTKNYNSPLTISNVEYDDHDQHGQTTSIIKMEEVEISINETDLFTDHKILSHDELLLNSFKDLRRNLDQEMNEQTSDIALHKSGSFMDDEYFPDDFLSSWLS